MNNDFRRRGLLPLLLPIAGLVGFLGVAFSLSRVFLAVSANQATFLALLTAAYVLLLAGLVSARPRIPSRALSVGLVIALAGVGIAGAVAGAAGMREMHLWNEHPGEDAPGEEAEADTETTVDPDALVFVAVDIDFSDAPATAPAGPAVIALVNDGGIVHDVTIDELDIHVVAAAGETVQEEVTLQPGTYTYYCSVPGHRAAGMEGTLEVS